MDFGSVPSCQSLRVALGTGCKTRLWSHVGLTLCLGVVLAGFPAVNLRADYPSKVIHGLWLSCMQSCQEENEVESCSRYCDCNVFELRRDLDDSQVEEMILIAERGGTGAEAIREWMRSTALICRKRVFDERRGSSKTHDPGA